MSDINRYTSKRSHVDYLTEHGASLGGDEMRMRMKTLALSNCLGCSESDGSGLVIFTHDKIFIDTDDDSYRISNPFQIRSA